MALGVASRLGGLTPGRPEQENRPGLAIAISPQELSGAPAGNQMHESVMGGV